MRIVDLLKMEYIVIALASKTKADVLKEIASVFKRNHDEIDTEMMIRILMARESLGSTGIGDGIAIPHGKMKALKEPVIAFGRNLEGIPFDSLDGRPAHLFFVIMVPEKTTGVHLKLLARLSRMLKDKAFRTMLLQAKTADEIFEAIHQKEQALQS